MSLEREGTVASPAQFGLNPASFTCRMLALFVLATLASLALSLAHTRADRDKAESSTLADAASIAATAALEIDDVVARARHVAEAVERRPEFWDGDDAARDATLAGALFTLVLLLWRRLSRRIRTLVAAAEHWETGDWGHRSSVGGADEIGELGTAFDRMAGELEATSVALARRDAERERALARREALLRVTRRFAAESDPDRLLDEVVEQAAQLVGTNHAFVTRWDDERRPLSLALLDLDHFKRVNDRYGHPIGDEVLRRIGQLLARSFRGEDVVARWGGEELAIGLYDSDKAATVERLERVLGQLREETFAGPDGATFHVTCSAGVAEYRADGETLPDLCRAAGAALYRAKRLGRDRVQPADAPLLAPPTLRAAG